MIALGEKAWLHVPDDETHRPRGSGVGDIDYPEATIEHDGHGSLDEDASSKTQRFQEAHLTGRAGLEMSTTRRPFSQAATKA